jgi:hypothetical protein
LKDFSSASSPGFSGPSSPPGSLTSGVLGCDGPEGGSEPGTLGATVVPPFLSDPPNSPSRPAGGGGFEGGFTGVAYDRLNCDKDCMGRNDRLDRAGSARRASRKDMASDREWIGEGFAALIYGLLVYAQYMRGV